jgi:hypothetical protein
MRGAVRTRREQRYAAVLRSITCTSK